MVDFIEELYFHNIDPQAPKTEPSSALGEKMAKQAAMEESLMERLDGEARSLFVQYTDIESETQAEHTLNQFKVGFRLGAAFMHSTFIGDAVPLSDPFQKLLKDTICL